MLDVLLITGALLASICGMGWLALAMSVHWSQVHGSAASSPPVRTLRALGALSLVGSLLLCMSADHPSIGVLVWVMSLAAAVPVVAFTLSWRAHWLMCLVAWARS